MVIGFNHIRGYMICYVIWRLVQPAVYTLVRTNVLVDGNGIWLTLGYLFQELLCLFICRAELGPDLSVKTEAEVVVQLCVIGWQAGIARRPTRWFSRLAWTARYLLRPNYYYLYLSRELLDLDAINLVSSLSYSCGDIVIFRSAISMAHPPNECLFGGVEIIFITRGVSFS